MLYDQHVYNVPMDSHTNPLISKNPLDHKVPHFDMLREGLNTSLPPPPRDTQRGVNPTPHSIL